MLARQKDMGGAEVLRQKHRAVLALARAGATDFAQSEYERYGLNGVNDDEDVMALAGRLAKDRYLRSENQGDAALSAALYEAAFEHTGGYYSGINSATMARLSKAEEATVRRRAEAVLIRIEAAEAASQQDRYYIEATRAEAYCLLGDEPRAAKALQKALAFDPLNYNAHASTYRQLKLLVNDGAAMPHWLASLRPPVCAHFAGHIFNGLADEAALSIRLSDVIQRHDIGFGYGSLAAGSDIVFAECLLREGGALHIILPVSEDVFIAKSVTPWGKDWRARYDACRAQAASIRIVSTQAHWPNPVLNNYAACVAMGAAVAQAHELSSEAAQVLIWDENIGGSLTAQHAVDWSQANESGGVNRPQIIVPYPDPRNKKPPHSGASSGPLHDPFDVMFAVCDGESSQIFNDPLLAMENAQNRLRHSPQGPKKIGVHVGPYQKATTGELDALAQRFAGAALPESILISQEMSNILALVAGGVWETSFMGCVDDTRAAYAAKPLNS
jgi:hypothetical protein